MLSLVFFPAFVSAGTTSPCTVGSTVSPSEDNIRSDWNELPFSTTGTGSVDEIGTGSVLISASKNSGTNCDDGPTPWGASVGDDVDTILGGGYSSQNFGGFPVSNGVGDWSDKNNYCVNVTNPNSHEVRVELLVLTSLGNSHSGSS